MFNHQEQVKVILVQVLALLAIWPHLYQCLIITSVLAGDKKFKTISFDTIFLKPLTFESELPTTEFRRHRTIRPPKFDIDVNIPIKLPLEDEYPQEEYKKPVVSDISFETGEIVEKKGGYRKQAPAYQQKPQTYMYKDQEYSGSNNIQTVVHPPSSHMHPELAMDSNFGSRSILGQKQQVKESIRRESDSTGQQEFKDRQGSIQPRGKMVAESSNLDYSGKSYGPRYPKNEGDYQPDFVPGGFVNLQLSGPTGGPKMTYEDFDREKWAQQLSQTAGAMPYPILNYHQLQNFYGGLGTFTNGIAESRYTHTSPLDLLKKGLHQLASKFHLG